MASNGDNLQWAASEPRNKGIRLSLAPNAPISIINETRNNSYRDSVHSTNHIELSQKRPSRKKSMFPIRLGAKPTVEKRPTSMAVKAAAAAYYEKLIKEGYSKEELDEYYQVFSLFDTDGSGSIGTTELANAMKSMGMNPGQNELETLIQEVDQDGNGEIDFQEFCDVMKRMSAKQVSWDDIIKQCFEVFDRNGSGTIGEEEFRFVLRELGDILNDQVIDDVFSEFDVDGNKVIDYAEFTSMVKNYLTDEDAESLGHKHA